MIYRLLLLLLLLWLPLASQSHPEAVFDPSSGLFRLSNSWLEVEFRISEEGTFHWVRLRNQRSGHQWDPPDATPVSLLRFQLGSRVFGPSARYVLTGQHAQTLPNGSLRQTIALEDVNKLVRVTLDLDLHPDQPVLRYAARLRNLAAYTVRARNTDMLPWSFRDAGQSYRAFRVNQWSVAPLELNFEPVQTSLNPSGQAFNVRSGSGSLHTGWLALRDSENQGLFFGWEFDGRTDATVRHLGQEERIVVSAPVVGLSHPLAPGGEFQIPAAFIGLYQGDWDEAGYRTQRFVEEVLAVPLPDDYRFPYVAWDSWGYKEEINERLLNRNAEIAASLGIELFTVDLGWAKRIGEWQADPDKFPSGLRWLSNRVRSLGMKFGLHFALSEVHPDAMILKQNPDWTASSDYNYFGSLSLCLAHQPVKDWLVAEAVRMIDEYGVDWFLQDGQTMVKQCTKTTHTHDPQDSNYTNSVLGLNQIIEEVRRLRPRTVWEHCANGGNMMTFNMVRHYVTSITNDANGALGARQAGFGATFPFPPRYANRYMPEEDLDVYTTRSYMFGGPWIFMNRLPEMSRESLKLASTEIAAYKAVRRYIRDGKVFHLTAFPGATRIDAIQAHHEGTDSAIAIVTRDRSPQATYTLRPRGLDPATTYLVRFQDDSRVLVMPGAQLMNNGVQIRFEAPRDAEIVYIHPVESEPF